MKTTQADGSLIADRRQKRIREQLRDGITEVRERETGVERDKRTRSIRQYLLIDEVEALLDYIEGLERDAIRVKNCDQKCWDEGACSGYCGGDGDA